MRKAALPVKVTRATLAVVDAELAVVREQKRGAEEEVREASSDEEHEALSARWFALTRGELRKKNRLDARLRIATEKLRPLEERERGLLARNAALEEAGREWALPGGAAREGAACRTECFPRRSSRP